MSNKWSMNDLKAKNIHVTPDGKGNRLPMITAVKSVKKSDIKKLEKEYKPSSKEKDFIYNVLLNRFGKELKVEYLGIPDRKFRFDYCVPNIKLVVEYEGIMGVKSGHTTVVGYTKNCEKYNLCTLGGWRLLRYTTINYKDLVEDLKKL